MQTFIDAFSLSLASQSKLGANSVSARVKDAVSTTSFESRSIAPKQITKQGERQASDISIAATSEAFTNAAQRLQAASDRLKLEADRQAKYWAELARLRSENWPVSRLPTNKKAIVVHFGSLESNPEYRNRGFATLRQDADGRLSFRSESAPYRSIMVRTLRDGQLSGQYLSKKDFSNYPALGADLMRARESLFQSELFTEASKEARTVSNMGFTCRSHSIRAEVSDSLSLEVLYGVDTDNDEQIPRQDDDIAVFVAAQLRTMLIAEHKYKHKQRAEQPPGTISQTSRPTPEYALLRPIIAQLRHRIRLAPVLGHLRIYKERCETAGLKFQFQHDTSSNETHENVSLTDLRLPVRSTIKITFPSGKQHTLTAETLLAPPRFGTQWLASTLKTQECGNTIFPQTADDKDIRRSLSHALAHDICIFIQSSTFKHTTMSVSSINPIELLVASDVMELAAIRVTCKGQKIGVGIATLDSKRRCGIYCEEDGIKIKSFGIPQIQNTGTLLKIITKALEECCS